MAEATGPRRKTRDTTRKAPARIPPLGDTVESVGEALDAVWELTARGELDTTTANVLDKLARAKLQAFRQRHSERELDEAREILRQIEENDRKAEARAVRARQGLDGFETTEDA